MKRKTVGLTVAAAAALAFVTAPVMSSAVYAADDVACYGVNACKGQGGCKTAKNDCKGQNTCKGKGMVMKSASDCEKMGGSLKEST